MAKTLSFETGLVEYDLNGSATVRFNPTDESFVSRLHDAFGRLDGLQARLTDGGGDAGDVLRRFGDLDAEMRETIDGLLGEGVAGALFPDMNCYSIADGLPVWCNLMLALLDEVAEAYEREFGKTDGRLKAHSAKFDAMMARYGRRDGKKA